MSFVSRLINPNPPLTPAQVQAAVAAALQANPPSPVRSIQRGVVTLMSNEAEKDVTITNVDLAKAQLRVLGESGLLISAGSGQTATRAFLGATLRLLHATTIRIELDASSHGSGSVSYEVIEYV